MILHEETNERFSQFDPDEVNRLDPFTRHRVEEQKVPAYVNFVRFSLRDKLNDALKIQGWPKCPENVTSLEDLFNQAFEAVNFFWQGPEIISRLQNELPLLINQNGDQSEYLEINDVFSNPDRLIRFIQGRQLGSVEKLRGVSPELWRTLVLLSSEYQLSVVRLIRRWMRQLPEEIFEHIQLSRSELDLFLDFAGVFGKYFDQAYVKQIELADHPGGSSVTKLTEDEVDGASYLYDPYKNGTNEIERLSYNEVFPFEWKNIGKHFRRFAENIRLQVQNRQLPQSYGELSDFFKKMSDVYGSDEKDPEQLDELWSDLQADSIKLIEKGCSLVLIPQGAASVAGDADKVDVELRLGIVGASERALNHIFRPFQDNAQKMLNSYLEADGGKKLVKEPYAIPPVYITYQPFSFGPNLHAHTQGESNRDQILVHRNVVEDKAREDQLPLLKIFSLDRGFDAARYVRAAVVETGLHEIGHTIMSDEDRRVSRRIGTGPMEDLVDQLKAETNAAKLLESIDLKESAEIDLHYQFLAKIGTLLDYAIHKSSDQSGHVYYYPGMYLLQQLLKEGILVEEHEGYRITDPLRGFEVLAKIGDFLFEQFYADESCRPKKVNQYAKSIMRSVDEDSGLHQFIEVVKQSGKLT